jgi:hypothetical protein
MTGSLSRLLLVAAVLTTLAAAAVAGGLLLTRPDQAETHRAFKLGPTAGGAKSPSGLTGGVGAKASASAKSDFIFGFSDNALRADPREAVSVALELGAKAFRITLGWAPGLTRLSDADAADLGAAASDPRIRVVLSVYALGGGTPLTPEARDQYCEYARSALERLPSVKDVVIWNEPNKSHFWRPQFNADGTSAAPAAYGQLLARCWDVLHAFRSDVNLVAPATSPKGNNDPRAASNISHSPGNFIRKLGQAYAASGRKQPLFDTVGQHVYGESTDERPWKRHRFGTTIALGDWSGLVQAYQDGFHGTPQPVPGECANGRCVSIWYMESGYQTTLDAPKAALYRGTENEKDVLPDFGGPADPAEPGDDTKAPDQAAQITDAVRLAYCQPYVGAYFNFLLWDESELVGWQSAPFWADRAPKDSYNAFKRVIAQANSGDVDCGNLKGTAEESIKPAPRGVDVAALTWPKSRSVNPKNRLWRFRIRTAEDATQRSGVYRTGGGKPILSSTGKLRRGYLSFVTFPARRLAPGLYRMQTTLISAVSGWRKTTKAGPTFRVQQPRLAPRRGKRR